MICPNWTWWNDAKIRQVLDNLQVALQKKISDLRQSEQSTGLIVF